MSEDEDSVRDRFLPIVAMLFFFSALALQIANMSFWIFLYIIGLMMFVLNLLLGMPKPQRSRWSLALAAMLIIVGLAAYILYRQWDLQLQ